MITSRRLALASSLSWAALGAVLIAGCTKPTQTQLQTYALAVAPVTDIVAPALLNKPNISPSDVAAVNKAAGDIKAAAALIANQLGVAPINAQSLVTGIQALAPVAIKYLAKGSYEAGLMQAAVDLGPLILQAAPAK